MSDVVDNAQPLEAMVRAQGIARARAALAGEGQAQCIDCDEPIEPERRAVLPAAKRCSCCQHDFDHDHRIELGDAGWFDPSPFKRARGADQQGAEK